MYLATVNRLTKMVRITVLVKSQLIVTFRFEAVKKTALINSFRPPR